MRLDPEFGYRLVIEGLVLRVQKLPTGWGYHIGRVYKTPTGRTEWTICRWAKKSQLEAIRAALTKLGRNDDPAAFQEQAQWVKVFRHHR